MIDGVSFVIFGMIAYGTIAGVVSSSWRGMVPATPQGAGIRILMTMPGIIILFWFSVAAGAEEIAPGNYASILWLNQTAGHLDTTTAAGLNDTIITTYVYGNDNEDFLYSFSYVPDAPWAVLHWLFGLILIFWVWLQIAAIISGWGSKPT